MRRCNIPPTTCRQKYAAPCCHDCQEEGCPLRCANSPERCGCWADKPPVRMRKREVISTQVVWLYTQGMTQKEVAEQLGCNVKTVAAVLNELGVANRGKS